MFTLKLRELVAPARDYIMYYTMFLPLLIVRFMAPLYMFMTGYSVLEAVAFYTIVNLSSIPITFSLLVRPSRRSCYGMD